MNIKRMLISNRTWSELSIRGALWSLRKSYYTSLNAIADWWHRWSLMLIAGVLLCVAAVTLIFAAPALQIGFGEIDRDSLSAIQTFLVTAGGSLIGATAIVSAMVVYALQVNVERMPHKLFRRLSTDPKILLAFIGTFSLATLVAALSVVVTQQNTVLPLFIAFWFSALILILFGFAYRRTLDLVNPNYQLTFLIKEARKDLSRWAKHADRISRSIAPEKKTSSEDAFTGSLDVVRLQFFRQFPHWTKRAGESLFYALNLATRYADKRDFAVVDASYAAVLTIHAGYLKAKGKTFVSANGFLDSPLTEDGFLSDTLESLRQMHREAVSQGNERLIVSNLQVMANLSRLYLTVDYGSPYVTSKTHANLAAHYLADAIKEVVPHNYPDALMQGIRLLGKHAQLCLAHDNTDAIPTLSEKISDLALVGIAREDHMPVTIFAVEELAKITIVLLQSSIKQSVRFPLHKVRRNIHQLAMLLVEHTKDNPLASRHSQALAGYYSATDATAFSGLLTELTSQLITAKADNEAAQQIIRNIEDWSDQLYVTQKELLLAAANAKSQFTFDMLYWVMQVTKLLSVLSMAAACPPHTQEELKKNANWLINTLSWLPDEEEAVTFLESFRIGDLLFSFAAELRDKGCYEIAQTAAQLLVSWAFRAGRHETGWGTLEHTLYGVAVLSLKPELQSVTSVEEIANYKTKYKVPQELLDRTACDIRSKAQSPFIDRHQPDIERALAHEDPERLVPALMAIANVLSPNTADDPIQPRHLF